uniref:hypothetical protein n=1 Tax=Microcoleus sp. LEGE 07076 TaxID=915322 RepID=UPI001D14F140
GINMLSEPYWAISQISGDRTLWAETGFFHPNIGFKPLVSVKNPVSLVPGASPKIWFVDADGG